MTEWSRILVRISPKSPLLFGTHKNGNYQETTDYIPGSSLRGAIAESLLEKCKAEKQLSDHAECLDPKTCSFRQLFDEEEPRFGDAYPGPLGPVWPMPLTSRTCKRYPGWQSSNDPDSHGIRDSLFADFAYGLVSDPQFSQRTQLQPELGDSWSSAWQPSLRATHDVCQFKLPSGHSCGQLMKVADKLYAYNGKTFLPAEQFRRMRTTHVGINRARSVAQDELLFTQETLTTTKQVTAFFAEIDVPSEREADLLEVLLGTHYMGRGRSRGNGEVVIARENSTPLSSVEDRLFDFQLTANIALATYQASDQRVSTTLPGQLFSVTLQTPAILQQWGQSVRVPEPDQLGLPTGTLLIRAWARMEQVGGWHQGAGLPRSTQLATRAGSVFLYFAPTDDVAQQTLVDELSRIEMEGIGKERTRGYGRVTICAPFHTLMSGY